MNRLTINADLGRHKISRHIYGHFSEHLGRCIYGGYWVGEDSPIPNTRGIRNDVVAALRNIKIPNLRWPGGCFADEYHWMDGIGPRAKRPCMINTHWGGVTENNHFGTHEFLDLCEQLGCEPYICGNVGSGTVQEMSQWVEYVNFDGQSPMSNLRAKNGRKAPWKVKFWGVGNENWGCGGNMSAEYYADQYRRYATYCRNYGGTELYKIACGPCGDDYHWTEQLMKRNKLLLSWQTPIMQGLALHHYTSPRKRGPRGKALRFGAEKWFDAMESAYYMETLVSRHSAIMDCYDPDRRVGLLVDEWGTWWDVEEGTNPGFLYQQNTLRDALVAGLTLNIFNNHCDRVRMGNIAQTINVLQAMILTEGEKMLLTPSYHVFEMYKVHQEATLLPVDLQCGKYSLDKDELPQLSVSASRGEAGAAHVTLCNLDPEQSASIVCAVRGIEAKEISGRILTAKAMNAHNTFDKPNALVPAVFKGAKTDGGEISLQLPAKSVVVLEIK